MIEPVLKDDAFLAEVRDLNKPVAPNGESGFTLWWLGQSGYLIQYQGKHALIDPYLSDSLTTKYAETDKPHVRMTERVIAPHRLDFIDVVSSSHNHTDHLDGDTLIPLIEANPDMTIIVPEANRDFAANRLQVHPDRLCGVDVGDMDAGDVDAGSSVEAAGFTFHAVPAAHEEFETDERGRHKFLGYVIQFGPWSVYHSGDTMLYEGMVDRLKPFNVDVALLPINGQLPERRVAGNLWGRQAAQLGHDIGARLVTPCHYDMFEFNTETPQEFVIACQKLEQIFAVLRNGQKLECGLSQTQ